MLEINKKKKKKHPPFLGLEAGLLTAATAATATTATEAALT